MKELEQKYIDILEENDWSVSSYTDDGRVELQKYSPAGEAIYIIDGGYGILRDFVKNQAEIKEKIERYNSGKICVG